ncbi:hypothetical protein GCM10020295_31810 [Streptomyces cinereospinus]
MTVVCGRSRAARVRAAASTWLRSGPPSAPRGGRGADDRGAHSAELARAHGVPEAPREHPAQFGGAERAGFGAGLVADGGDAGGDRGLGQRQAERAESDDGEICGHGVGRPSQ